MSNSELGDILKKKLGKVSINVSFEVFSIMFSSSKFESKWQNSGSPEKLPIIIKQFITF